tara:strand:- start:315 stop:500 length:186 start_codon:yes stop_codon:yes gene_type:complete
MAYIIKFENEDGIKFETPVIESNDTIDRNVINENEKLIPKEFRHPDKRWRKTQKKTNKKVT